MDYKERTKKSEELYNRANKVLPAGVSYSIRALPPYPFYVREATGVKIKDVDGNTYTDYWVGHGALILGHSPKPVIEAVMEQLDKGTHFGFAHEHEVALAEKIIKHLPSGEKMRYCASGTEANMYGSRLARAYTGNMKMLKIEGGWHGGYDSLHAHVSPPYERSESAGLNPKVTEDTFAVPFNDLDSTRKIVKKHKFSCIILEPVMGAAGFLTPEPGYLEGLREICNENDILLIFDEVVTGFRLGLGGAQEYYGVEPDMTILGKIIGGGFPIGAFCASDEIMEKISHIKYPEPETRSAHGGTFTGNPISTVAGKATIEELEKKPIYKKIDSLGEKMRKGLGDIFERGKIPASVTGVGSVFGIHFQETPPKNAGDTMNNDMNITKKYFQHMLEKGIIYLSPTTSHSWISSPHIEQDVDEYLAATEEFIKNYTV
jgi:glutamate-1-semialdehyde 2,1-aminomutase